jgi:glyceraldehyde 3-phosphate dehydrogenase
MKKIAINGMGRIGRAVLRIVLESDRFELVAINDIIPLPNMLYLLRYDTVYGQLHKGVAAQGNDIMIGDKTVRYLNEKDPASLPWEELGADTVFECTGLFRKKEELQRHISAGAKQVILSAPAKSEDITTVVHGVNGAEGNSVISCASCTTNCITPLVEIIGRRIGIEKAIMTTIHAYTSTQNIVDGPSGKMRRGRAAAQNLVPTSTGAAAATTHVLPEHRNRFDGVAVRCPIAAGSLADITFLTSRATDTDEVNSIFQEEAEGYTYMDILGISKDPLVSSDIIKDPRAAVVDLSMTRVVDNNLVKIMAWYDNEWGYANQMVREAAQAV